MGRMIAPRIVVNQSTHRIAFWNNVVITNVEGDLDAAGVRAITDAFNTLHRSYPDGVAGITVLRSSLKVGTSDTNAEAQRAMTELRTKILHVAVVIEDQGLLTLLLRAIVRTLNSIARNSCLSIASHPEEAVRAIVHHVKVGHACSTQELQAELVAVVELLRRAA